MKTTEKTCIYSIEVLFCSIQPRRFLTIYKTPSIGCGHHCSLSAQCEDCGILGFSCENNSSRRTEANLRRSDMARVIPTLAYLSLQRNQISKCHTIPSAHRKANNVPTPSFKFKPFSDMAFLQSNIAYIKTTLKQRGMSRRLCRRPRVVGDNGLKVSGRAQDLT